MITYDNADKKEWYNFKMNWTRNFRHDIYKYPKISIKYRTWKVYPSYFPCWTNVTFSNNTNILYIDSKNLSRCIINLELWLCCISRWILFPFSMFFFLSFPLRGNMKNIGIHVISPRAVYSRRETVSQIYATGRECFLANRFVILVRAIEIQANPSLPCFLS